METWMKFLQIPVTTLKDNQRQGRWDRLEVYLNDHERPWKTTNDPVVSLVSYGNNTKYLWRPPTTLKDRQRLAVSKFCAKSSSLNKYFERPLTTMKDCQRRQRLAVIPNDPDTPITAKDRQRHPATGNEYMETRLNPISTELFWLV